MSIDLKKIGTFLKEIREEKGLTPAEISNKLCVRKSLINALESGTWEMLPHEVYVRGYLKEYAHLLGVYDEIAAEIVQKNEIQSVVEIPVQVKSGSGSTRLPTKAIVYPLALVLLVGFVILSQINKDRPVPRITPAEHKTQPATNVSAVETQNVATEVSTAKKLMISCLERTWVSVVIDDYEKKEFMLNPEEIVILNARSNYDLLIGNAAGVKLILDGKDVELTGMSGEVKRVKLS
jgi:cytoskeletal protein RodZ